MARTARPGTVTIVVVLVWIYAILMIAAGALWLFAADDAVLGSDADLASDQVTSFGWTVLVLGVITALVAIGLGRGSRLSRFIVIALMVVRIGVEVLGLLGIDGYPLWSALLSIAWAVLIISMLSTRRAARWFLDT